MAMPAGGFAGERRQQQQQSGSGTFTMKVKTDIVLTNVVVRDKKTGEMVKGLKASDFTILRTGSRRRSPRFDYQNVDEAAVLAEKTTVTGKAVDGGPAEQQLRGGPGRVAGSSADRDVLRPEQHAAGGHRPRGRGGAGLHQQADAAGGPGGDGEPGRPG